MVACHVFNFSLCMCVSLSLPSSNHYIALFLTNTHTFSFAKTHTFFHTPTDTHTNTFCLSHTHKHTRVYFTQQTSRGEIRWDCQCDVLDWARYIWLLCSINKEEAWTASLSQSIRGMRTQGLLMTMMSMWVSDRGLLTSSLLSKHCVTINSSPTQMIISFIFLSLQLKIIT